MTRLYTRTVEHCLACPLSAAERVYTADSFETVTRYVCEGMSGRKIAVLDLGDKAPPIPEWCPLAEPDTTQQCEHEWTPLGIPEGAFRCVKCDDVG